MVKSNVGLFGVNSWSDLAGQRRSGCSSQHSGADAEYDRMKIEHDLRAPLLEASAEISARLGATNNKTGFRVNVSANLGVDRG